MLMNQNQLYSKLWGRFRLVRLAVTNPTAFRLIRQVMRNGWSYLNPRALNELYNTIAAIEKANQPGIFIEAGCALGGSAIVIAQAKKSDRPFFIYDAFGMIPPPSARDQSDAHRRYAEIASGQSQGIKGKKYYGYEENLLIKVQANFATSGLPIEANSVKFVPGFYEDTLWVDQPVAFAHIDCDWHDSVLVCLERIVPQLTSAGVIVIDDYTDWSGCKTAVDSYFANRKDKFEFVMQSRLHIIHKA